MSSIPSVYVKLCGGLGNQLFQIANGYAYSLRHNKNFYASKEWEGMKKERPSYWNSLLKSLVPYLKDISEFKGTLYREPTWKYQEIPYIEGDIILEGYFQSEKYFEDRKEDIRKLFNIYPQRDSSSLTKSIAVHIRRGDYLANPLFHTILQKDYYDRAKSVIKNKFEDNIKYVYFSDDIKWVKDTFENDIKDKDEIISSLSDIEEFQSMVNCNGFIIANSTFSWWASWFAGSDFICAPFNWFGPHFSETWSSIYRTNFFIL